MKQEIKKLQNKIAGLRNWMLFFIALAFISLSVPFTQEQNIGIATLLIVSWGFSIAFFTPHDTKSDSDRIKELETRLKKLEK